MKFAFCRFVTSEQAACQPCLILLVFSYKNDSLTTKKLPSVLWHRPCYIENVNTYFLKANKIKSISWAKLSE